METHNKLIGCPKTPYELFLKLYFKKRRSSIEKQKVTLSEAVKAWTVLNEDEKKIFIEKFMECKAKRLNEIGICLQRTEPYMKKKQSKRLSPPQITRDSVDSPVREVSPLIDEDVYNEAVNINIATSKNSTNQKHNNTKSVNMEEYEDPVLSEHAPPNVSIATSKNSTNQKHNNTKSVNMEECEVPVLSEHAPPNVSNAVSEISAIQEHTNTKIKDVAEYEVPVLSEPTPPNVRNSIELFNKIKNQNGQDNLEWSSLSKVEKIHYRSAVYQLKKDYIRNFKTYLESLPSKELYKYYHTFQKS